MLDGLPDEPSPWFSVILYRLQTLRRRGRDEARLPQRGYRTLIELKDNEAMTFSRTELRGSVYRNQEAPAWLFVAHANRFATKRVVSGFDKSNEIAGIQARLRRDVD
jgi:hypothetical protein